MIDEQIECYYDLYAAMLAETFDIFRDPDRQRAIARAQGVDSLREAMAIDPNYLYRHREPPRNLLMMEAQHKRCRPYILGPAVAKLATEIVDKAGSRGLPVESFLSVPLWFELEGMSIGSEEEQFSCFFLYHDFLDQDSLRFDMISPNVQRVKTLIFKQSGWEYEQEGRCISPTCNIARYTEEGFPFRVCEDHRLGEECNCWVAAFHWAQLVRSCNYLLKHRREPLRETTYVREVPRPYVAPATRKEKEANSQAQRASRPNIVTLSLSAPVATTRRASKPHESSPSTNKIEMEKISVEGHWRVLIPGQGLPWKEFQIIPIESYEKSTHNAKGRTRFRVEE